MFPQPLPTAPGWQEKAALYQLKSSSLIIFVSTVKLGYNELGYSEHSVITNKKFSPK